MMGRRGEDWVGIQLLLFALILLSPRLEMFPLPLWLRAVGALLLAIGGLVGTMGVLSLGTNLTVFPKPREGGYLVRGGAYRVVRHPIYSGLILGTFGWALLTDTLLGLAMGLVLFIFFDLKSRREERWLAETYADYPAYQRQVKKLIPWLY